MTSIVLAKISPGTLIAIDDEGCDYIEKMAQGETVKLKIDEKKKDRSLDQNAISHAWYEQLSKELKEDDALGWKCFCKLNFGIPILRAEDAEFREFYDSAIKNTFTYEHKLGAMKYMPVTSLMNKKQFSKYLEEMQATFQKRGVMLNFPDMQYDGWRF